MTRAARENSTSHFRRSLHGLLGALALGALASPVCAQTMITPEHGLVGRSPGDGSTPRPKGQEVVPAQVPPPKPKPTTEIQHPGKAGQRKKSHSPAESAPMTPSIDQLILSHGQTTLDINRLLDPRSYPEVTPTPRPRN